MSLIIPAKLWRSLSGGGVRRLLTGSTSIRELHDLSDAPQLFDAAVYPSVVIASKCDSARSAPIVASAFKRRDRIRWTIPRTQLAFDESHGSPLLILPSAVRRSFDCLKDSGIPLSATRFGRPLLGTKTGCNEAFLVDSCADIEPALLRPVIRGDGVRRWTVPEDASRIIWTHDRHGALSKLPPGASRWLVQWRRELELRTDMRGKTRWWTLFRTESADSAGPRVIWTDIGKQPRAAVLRAGDRSVPLNTCYVIRCPDLCDAMTLAAIINSQLMSAWLAMIAEPARGGYRRFMGWTMSLLPLPRDWQCAREILAPLARDALEGSPPDDETLLQATLDAYTLDRGDVESLLEWCR
jgi:hypothetical protein